MERPAQNFPENIECCVNSDDPPPSQLEQLLQQMDQTNKKRVTAGQSEFAKCQFVGSFE